MDGSVKGSSRKPKTPRELGGNAGGSKTDADSTHWFCIVEGRPGSDCKVIAAIPVHHLASTGVDGPPTTNHGVSLRIPDNVAPVVFNFPGNVTATGATRKRRPNLSDEDRAKDNAKIAAYLVSYPDAGRDEIAQALGIAAGHVSASPAFRVVQAERKQVKAARRAHGGRALELVAADDDPE